MLGKHLLSAFALAFVLVAGGAARADFLETFGTDPIGTRGEVEGPGNSLDTSWLPVDAFEYVGPGTLMHNQCSNWYGVDVGEGDYDPDTTYYVDDASRLSFALGGSYTENDYFSFGARLQIHGLVVNPNPVNPQQVSFGLTRYGVTGMDRSSWSDPNAYDTIEWDFFPERSGAGEWGEPTCQQVVIGSQGGAASAYERLDANWGYTLPGDFPTDTWLNIALAYDAGSQTLSVSVTDDGGTPLVDETTVPDLTLENAGGFVVDRFSLLNYQDPFGSGMPTLTSAVEYDEIWFQYEGSVPEPGSAGLVVLGVLGLLRRRRGA